MTTKLTPELIQQTQCPQDRRHVELFDSEVAGLYADFLSSGRVQFRLRYRANGRYRFLTIGDHKDISLDEARARAKSILRDVEAGVDPKPESNQLRPLTVGRFFLDHYLPYARSYKRSWETDVSVIQNHLLPTLGAKPMASLQLTDFTQLVHAMLNKGYAPGTTNRVVIMLRFAYKLARQWSLVPDNCDPTQNLKSLKFDNRIERYLTEEQLDKLFESLMRSENERLSEIVAFLVLTGARKQEALRAKWVDVDVGRRLWRIPVTKSSKIRRVPLSSAAIEVLNKAMERRQDQDPYVFTNPKTRKPFVNIFHSWDTARRRAGLPELRIHDLRHSFASFLVNAGRSLYEVQEILGHADIRTTSRYAHLNSERLLQAVATVPHFWKNK